MECLHDQKTFIAERNRIENWGRTKAAYRLDEAMRSNTSNYRYISYELIGKDVWDDLVGMHGFLVKLYNKASCIISAKNITQPFY